MLATINTPKVQAPFGVSLLHLVLIIQGYNHSGLFVGSMLLIFLVCCVVLLLCFYVLYVFFLHLVCPMLPASLNCPFFIAPPVFPNVYIICSNKNIPKYNCNPCVIRKSPERSIAVHIYMKVCM